MTNKKYKIIDRLRNKEYRDSFVESHIKIGIPFQIRVLREDRGWTQQELADRVGVKQAWIAQIENPNYSGFSLKTLLKLASIFDIGLIVRFVPISDLVKLELELSSETLKVKSFEDEDYFKPPVISIVPEGGIACGGEGIVKFMNSHQAQTTNIFFLKDYRKPTEEKDKTVKIFKDPLQAAIRGER